MRIPWPDAQGARAPPARLKNEEGRFVNRPYKPFVNPAWERLPPVLVKTKRFVRRLGQPEKVY